MLSPAAARSWLSRHGRPFASNALSGLVASLLTIAYCLSFSALLFQGELSAGFSMCLWGLLAGTAIAGVYVAATTSLPPAEAGPDNPAVAVLSVLAATISGAVLGAGGSVDRAIDHVLISFTIATFVTGLVLYGIGALRLAQVVRFIPYPVIAGFLAASGWLLLTGGIEVVTKADFSLLHLFGSLPAETLPRLLVAALFAGTVYAVKAKTGGLYVLPIAFAGGSLVLDVILNTQGLMTETSGWFLSGTSDLKPWTPLKSIFSGEIDWRVFLTAAPEIGAIAGVTVIALMLDITGLEVARMASADFDHEFRTNGIANVISAPLGGIMGNLSLNGSRLLDETGGYQRVSGIIASLVAGAVALTNADLPGYVPAPILAGLLMYLGLVVLNDVLLKSPAQKAWTDFGLALAIMIAIVCLGYLAGVVFGFVAACLTFAFNYSRVAVVRRHLTRLVYASNMERSSSAERTLQEEGERIHIFWLSGFIFFGSSNRVLETIRAAIAKTPAGHRRYAVLDFSEVSGFDTSALLSLVKLRNFADDNGITLSFAGLAKRLQAAFGYVKLLPPGSPHRIFASRNEALEWCEGEVLSGDVKQGSDNAKNDFEDWLAAELGGRDKARRVSPFFELRHLTAGTPIYVQGAPPDSIDLVIGGTVAVMLDKAPGGTHLVRRMSKRTVVGEMGFFRGLPRVASVVPEQGAIIYTLTRANYERMMAGEPEVGAAFLEFVIRAISDRLDFANSGIVALN